MKIELSNPATRFLALSAIALTLASAPSRADWTSVRPDGTIVTVSSSLKVGDGSTPEDADATAQNAGGADAQGNDDYALDTNEAPEASPARPAAGRPQARSARVQRNRDLVRERNSSRRSRGEGGNAGFLQPMNRGGLSYGVVPGSGLGYGAAPAYPNYPGYAAPGYGYGYGYGYPGGVVAPGATIVLPQVPYTVPIGQAPYPWVQQPTFTSIPVGGTTIITNPGYNGYPSSYPGGYYPGNCAPYPPIACPYGYPGGYGYPTGYPSGYGYGYPNGTYTQSYGGLSISRGGLSVSVGGTTTSTQSAWGTGLYR